MHALALLLAAALAVDSTASRRAAPETEFPVVLGSYSTTLIGSSPARTANLRLAAAALDGEILRSGEELSFNAVVGPRTTARGYQVAPVLLRSMSLLDGPGHNSREVFAPPRDEFRELTCCLV